MPDTKVKGMTVKFNPTTRGIRYETWYDFKKDLESVCGRPILNLLWLQVKPQIALPWDRSNLHKSLLKLKRINRQRNINN